MQYSFFVPHAPERLVEKMGRDTFNQRLDSIFTEARKMVFGGGTLKLVMDREPVATSF